MFAWLTGTAVGKFISTFFISMVPIVELRLGLPYGIALGLPYGLSLTAAVLGNMVPVPFIIVYIKRIFAWLRRRSARFNTLVDSLERRAEGKKATVEKYAFWGLFLFVAIPLPGTGAWTGSLIAAMMDMKVKDAFPSILLGVLTAGVIISFVTYGAGALLFG
jgi:uncharacterized membrane protein